LIKNVRVGNPQRTQLVAVSEESQDDVTIIEEFVTYTIITEVCETINTLYLSSNSHV
jgi:hypothetical protein